jgi:hypothetical protein
MKTPRRIQPWAFAAPLLTVLGAAACVEPKDGDLVIQQAQVIDRGECIASLDESLYLSRGTVDLAVAQSYTLFPLVRNNIENIRETKGYGPRDLRLNTKRVSLRRAKITYRPQDEIDIQLRDREVPLSASVDSTGGLTTVSVELLTPAMAREFRNSDQFLLRGSQGEVRPARTSIDLSVGVTIEGETQDGNAVETNEFVFTLRVCNGCLVYYPAGNVAEDGPAPNCNAATDEEVAFCAVGWELPVSCSACQSFAPDALARQLCQPPL